jgi:hypothetical protein
VTEPDRPEPIAPAHGRRPSARFYVGVVVVGLLLVGALIWGRSLGLVARVLDTREVERDVAAQFEERYGVAIDVECPRDMEVDQGSTHECDAVTADHEKVTVVLTITDEDPVAYEWDVD